MILFGYVLAFALPLTTFVGLRVLAGFIWLAALVCDRCIEWQARQAPYYWRLGR